MKVSLQFQPTQMGKAETIEVAKKRETKGYPGEPDMGMVTFYSDPLCKTNIADSATEETYQLAHPL